MQIRRVQVAWCSHAHDTVENPFATAEPRRSGLVEASCNRQVTNRHSGVVNLAASREQGGAIFSKPYFETLPFMRYPPPPGGSGFGNIVTLWGVGKTAYKMPCWHKG